jgi:hypothetical protein
VLHSTLNVAVDSGVTWRTRVTVDSGVTDRTLNVAVDSESGE